MPSRKSRYLARNCFESRSFVGKCTFCIGEFIRRGLTRVFVRIEGGAPSISARGIGIRTGSRSRTGIAGNGCRAGRGHRKGRRRARRRQRGRESFDAMYRFNEKMFFSSSLCVQWETGSRYVQAVFFLFPSPFSSTSFHGRAYLSTRNKSSPDREPGLDTIDF